MKFPIVIGFRYSKSDLTWQGYQEVVNIGKSYPPLMQVYLRNDIEAILDWPARQWRLAKHRYYYGRLEYQYQAGHAVGLREGLLNSDTYFEMTAEELAASLGITAEQAESIHTKAFMRRNALGMLREIARSY